ncbi:MAG: hypothetical protein DI630_26510 [Gordonia sp. (in: high G+C Gram-positive bacteria)]|nr:MAG: hypothetical protein DI630_26510 [Gordonia sp. (in: high G+C Gram-positive bacteria)]
MTDLRSLRLSERLATVQPSPTLALAALVKQRRARGESVIAFNSGEPLADVPAYIADAASMACRMEEMHRYTDARGPCQRVYATWPWRATNSNSDGI